MELTLWNSIAICLIFSCVVIFLDGYVVKPYREKKWERDAAAGDEEKRALLEIVRNAKVVDE